MESKPKNILIGVDASDQAFEAVRYAGRVLPVGDVEFTLLHILSILPDALWDLESAPAMRYQVKGFQAWETRQRKMIDEFMDRARGLLVSMGYPKEAVSVVVRQKEAGIARDIAKMARGGHDAVIVGRRGISEMKDLIFGSTASKLLNLIHQLPLVIVGGKPDPSKTLIAMDNSQGAAKALEYAGGLLNTRNVQLLLLYVSRGLGFFPAGYGPFLLPDEESELLEHEREALEAAEGRMEQRFRDCIRTLEGQGADVSRISTKIVRSHSRSSAIIEVAENEGCGTIVVGRRGLSRVEEFIMGRVSSKVLQLAKNMAVWVVS